MAGTTAVIPKHSVRGIPWDSAMVFNVDKTEILLPVDAIPAAVPAAAIPDAAVVPAAAIPVVAAVPTATVIPVMVVMVDFVAPDARDKSEK